MPLNFPYLLEHTKVSISEDVSGCLLLIETPRLNIRSVEENDIPFFQNLWASSKVMENFATGKPRLYSGTEDEKNKKLEEGADYDYAVWRIKASDSSWLKRRRDNNIWHGLTIFNKSNERIGHIVLGGGELAYFLEPNVWNNHFASEACISLICIAVPYISIKYPDIEIPKIINATVRIDHLISQKVLLNTGFEINETTEISEKFGHKRYEVKAFTSEFIAKYKNYFNNSAKLGFGNVVFFPKEVKDEYIQIQRKELAHK